MRHHWLATYRRSLVAVLRAQGTDKGLQDGAAGVAQLLQSSPLVQVLPGCFAGCPRAGPGLLLCGLLRPGCAGPALAGTGGASQAVAAVLGLRNMLV